MMKTITIGMGLLAGSALAAPVEETAVKEVAKEVTKLALAQPVVVPAAVAALVERKLAAMAALA